MGETEAEIQAEPRPQRQSASASLAGGRPEEIFRSLWASVFYAAPEAPRSVLVCSANRQEGATTVACALALAGAGSVAAPGGESGPDRVVLVDLNLHNPAVHKQLNLSDGGGVSDVLVGEKPLADVLRHVGPGKLDVLTVGTRRDRLLEVLRQDRVRDFLADLERHYGHVIIDTAPANMYPDAQVLAGVVRSAVLVAQSQQTARESLQVARKCIEAGGGKVLGVVLNMRTFPIPRFVYRRV